MTDANGPSTSDTPPGEEQENSAVLDFSGVHRMIRGFMTKFPAAVSSTSGDPRRAKAVANLLLFGVAGLRFHHHVEDDEYWPALVAKGADAAALEPLSAAHRELDPMLDHLESAARHLAAAPTDAATATSIAELIPGFVDHVSHHLDEEEPIMFPMLRRYITDPEAHTMAARAARKAPRDGLPWLIGGVSYAMTPVERRNFLVAFPKPIIWLSPLLLRRYRRNCAVIGVAPEFS
jgi:hypothetical protein